MEKFNVICIHCGKKEYNPNIPAGHIIDCCSSIKCREESEGKVIGFKNGDIHDCSVFNLYGVYWNYIFVEDFQLPVTEFEITDKFALAKYEISQENFIGAVKILRDNKIENTPEGLYLMSKIHFKAYNNPSLGVKCLKKSSELGFPPSMAEYGYIITMKMYGVSSNPNLGIQQLLEAYDKGSIISAAYLADVYKSGPKDSKGYKSISNSKWFEIVEKAANTIHDEDAELVLGYFYYVGIGTGIDYKLAYDYLKLAADKEYVVAEHLFANLILNPASGLLNDSTILEAEAYCNHYLKHATCNTNYEYADVKSMYKEIQDLKNLPDIELK
jgi:TPR repeat protein